MILTASEKCVVYVMDLTRIRITGEGRNNYVNCGQKREGISYIYI